MTETKLRERIADLQKQIAELPAPQISDGPDDGSIDALWRTDRIELLVNITERGSGDFWGKIDGTEIKGAFLP